jgi:hypothetical protein
MPENTVTVDRTTPRGNPFVVRPDREPGTLVLRNKFTVPTNDDAVECFREMMGLPGETADAFREMLPELRGKNVACWCCLDEPCHGDVWLELANRSEV